MSFCREECYYGHRKKPGLFFFLWSPGKLNRPTTALSQEAGLPTHEPHPADRESPLPSVRSPVPQHQGTFFPPPNEQANPIWRPKGSICKGGGRLWGGDLSLVSCAKNFFELPVSVRERKWQSGEWPLHWRASFLHPHEALSLLLCSCVWLLAGSKPPVLQEGHTTHTHSGVQPIGCSQTAEEIQLRLGG